MRPEYAVQVLNALIDNIHPLAGENLSDRGIRNEQDIVAALNCAIQALNEQIVAKRAIEEYRRQHGLSVSDSVDIHDNTAPIDNDELSHRFLHGETIAELARRYGRTEKAIRMRLFYLGFGGNGPELLPGRKQKDSSCQ